MTRNPFNLLKGFFYFMKRIIFTYPVLFSLAWAFVILVLCATPGQYIPSAGWMELLSLDKLIHASIFFVLTALLIVVALRYRQKNGFISFYVTVSILYGMLMELMQAYYFSNRSADWMDVIANTAGCLFALALRNKIRQWISPAII
jgi:hypothetical protein